jgi:hypothetical protein
MAGPSGARPSTRSVNICCCGTPSEVLGCIRVQLKTDLRNIRSQQAIERLSILREGILRKHMILPDGHQRSSVIYSVIDDEWPDLKDYLEALMRRSSVSDSTNQSEQSE